MAALDRILDRKTNKEAAQELNTNGYRNYQGELFDENQVKILVRYHGLKSHLQRQRQRLRDQDYQTAAEIALRLKVDRKTIYTLAKHKSIVKGTIIRNQKRNFYMFKLESGEHDDHAEIRQKDNSKPAEITKLLHQGGRRAL